MHSLVNLAFTIAANALIAVLLTIIGFGPGFAINLLFSQCIGLSILFFVGFSERKNMLGWQRWLVVVLSLICGSLIGSLLARWLADMPIEADHVVLQTTLISLVFGGTISVFFILRERNARLQAELRQGEIDRLEADKRSIEAQLRMLQAQIEPHFLFNTLSNVSVLIDSEPMLARRLLDALILYLRSSLARTRSERASLKDEIELLRAYLEILKIRLGERLNYTFAIDPELCSQPFPPMLLQPLVENAVTHGIEPKRGGGAITVTAHQKDGCLNLTVCDNGIGFAETGKKGIGLENIRSRLHVLYGDTGKLELSENADGGVIASIRIPLCTTKEA